MDNLNPLYDKSYTCLLCDQRFTTPKVRSSKIRVVHQDSDLCSHFADIIPYYYEINVCPHCGYAFSDSFSHIKSNMKMQIRNAYERYLVMGIPTINKERDAGDAILAFKLALAAGITAAEPSHFLAGICMRLAWLYRYSNLEEEENKFLEAAHRFFQDAYQNQYDDINEAYYLHMLGETSLRLNRTTEAKRWFSLLFAPAYRDYRFINLARDSWAAYRHQQE